MKFGKVEVKPRTTNQKRYLDSIESNTIVICEGPAASGKTFLAVAKAMYSVECGFYQTLVLLRPAVEAGEKIGLLPGTVQEKIDPYMQPFYHNLYKLYKVDAVQQKIHTGQIDVQALGLIRGLTYDDSIIIFDEAQNCTPKQMKLALTRLGRGSKMIICGDVTQSDIKVQSGLDDMKFRLEGLEKVGFVQMELCDNQRNPILEKVMERYAGV